MEAHIARSKVIATDVDVLSHGVDCIFVVPIELTNRVQYLRQRLTVHLGIANQQLSRWTKSVEHHCAFLSTLYTTHNQVMILESSVKRFWSLFRHACSGGIPNQKLTTWYQSILTVCLQPVFQSVCSSVLSFSQHSLIYPSTQLDQLRVHFEQLESTAFTRHLQLLDRLTARQGELTRSQHRFKKALANWREEFMQALESMSQKTLEDLSKEASGSLKRELCLLERACQDLRSLSGEVASDSGLKQLLERLTETEHGIAFTAANEIDFTDYECPSDCLLDMDNNLRESREGMNNLCTSISV